MATISAQLKEALLQSMEGDTIYNNSQLKDLIFKETGMTYGKEYQESHFAGCLIALRKKGLLEQVDRGEYRKVKAPLDSGTAFLSSDGGVSLTTVQQEILSYIRKEIHDLQNIAKNINVDYTITDKDYENLVKIKELIQFLQNFKFSK